jgi:hypothetical protein
MIEAAGSEPTFADVAGPRQIKDGYEAWVGLWKSPNIVGAIRLIAP